MKHFKKVPIILDQSDIDLCNQILELFISTDNESILLAKSLFKTSNFYKNNKVTTLYVDYLYQINIKYLLSNNYPCRQGNFYYYVLKWLIKRIALNNIPEFYRNE